jgi:hypothetical protein
MKISLTLYNEYRDIDVKTGLITRHVNNQPVYQSSSQWVCTGAIITNNFGHVVERLSLFELYNKLKTNKHTLFYKNGKAKFTLTDIDHGTARAWVSDSKYLQRHRIIAF